MSDRQSFVIRITFLDGSEGEWDTKCSDKKMALQTFRSQAEYLIDSKFYTKQSVFYWEIVGE